MIRPAHVRHPCCTPAAVELWLRLLFLSSVFDLDNQYMSAYDMFLSCFAGLWLLCNHQLMFAPRSII